MELIAQNASLGVYITGGLMTKLILYDSDGKKQFDSSKVVYSLIKSDHLKYLGKNSSDEATYRMLVMRKLQHVLYIDVVATEAPIAFTHYDGDVYEQYGVDGGFDGYKMIAPLHVAKINQNTYRFYFFSLVALSEPQLRRYRVYLFDRVKIKAKVGLTTYDQDGGITFSTHHHPLKIVDYRQPRLPNANEMVMTGEHLEYLLAHFVQHWRRLNIPFSNNTYQAMLRKVHEQVSDYIINKKKVGDTELDQLIYDYCHHSDYYGMSWHFDKATDIFRHLLHKDRRYASFYNLGIIEFQARYFHGTGEGYEPCTFTALGVNGGLVAGACMMSVPLLMSGDRNIRYDFYLYPQHPPILTADVTDMPFPFNRS